MQSMLLPGFHARQVENSFNTFNPSLHEPLERSGCTGHKRLLVRASIQEPEFIRNCRHLAVVLPWLLLLRRTLPFMPPTHYNQNDTTASATTATTATTTTISYDCRNR